MSPSALQACPRREHITRTPVLWLLGSYINGEPCQEVRRQQSNIKILISLASSLQVTLNGLCPSRQAALQDTPGSSPSPCSWPAPDHRAIPGVCLPKPLTWTMSTFVNTSSLNYPTLRVPFAFLGLCWHKGETDNDSSHNITFSAVRISMSSRGWWKGQHGWLGRLTGRRKD